MSTHDGLVIRLCDKVTIALERWEAIDPKEDEPARRNPFLKTGIIFASIESQVKDVPVD